MTVADPAVPSDASQSSDTPSLARGDLGLFLVSAAVLTLEVLQFKIFAYSLDALRIYLAVGVCLLGLGASATLLAILPRVEPQRARRLAAFFAALGGLLLAPVHGYFASTAAGLGLATLTALTLPYLCFGMTISLLLVSRAKAMGRAYGVNLAGSAVGCLIVFPLLDALGAERAVVVAGGLSVVGGLVLHVPQAALGRVALVAALGLLGYSWTKAEAWMPFPPDPTGQLSVVNQHAAQIRREHGDDAARVEHLYSEWDRTARVDVYELETTVPELQSRVGGPLETRFFVQDSSAGSFLLGVYDDNERAEEFYDGTLYGAAYQAADRENVLLVGLGGAPDVLTALHFDAEHIQGVDINGATIDLVGEHFAEFLGNPYGNEHVTVHQMDGRTFLRSSEEKFDLIQMSGVDTKSILASGSLSVNENYVYTREAMGEMLARITDDGMIAFLRFTDGDAHKLASVAIAGLRDLGVEDERQHLFVLGQGLMRAVLIKRTPFTEAEVERLYAWLERRGGEAPDITIPTYDWIDVSYRHPLYVLYSPEPRHVATTPYFKQFWKGNHDEFLEHWAFDLSAPTDNRPFFFFREKFEQALTSPSTVMASLYGLILKLTLVSTAFILLPLVVLKGRGLRTPRAGRSILYFCALGVGFMLFEIGLMHQFVLLLGHQSYAITVVLLGLLVGASLGSACSGRFDLRTPRPVRLALFLLVVAILASSLLLPSVFSAAATLPFTARLGIALVILVGLGFLLGIPFPSALRSVETTSPALVPWGIGINGFASTIGSTLAVPAAMLFGLGTLIHVAAGLYLLALAVCPIGESGSSKTS